MAYRPNSKYGKWQKVQFKCDTWTYMQMAVPFGSKAKITGMAINIV